jgi:hypothetical protein
MRNRWNKGKNPFRLPLSITFGSYERRDGKWVYHALDFDLVSVADTKSKALEKLRSSVKTYVEFGLSKNWHDDIIFPAPDEYWERLPQQGKVVEMLHPIEIEDTRVQVYDAPLTHEPRRVAVSA